MKKPVGPKARPSLKNCKPEPGPGPIVKVQARDRPAREKKLKPEPGPSPRKVRPDTSLAWQVARKSAIGRLAQPKLSMSLGVEI